MSEEIFPIVPASASVYWVLIPALAILVFIGGLLGYAAYASRRTAFAISDSGLRIRGDIYGREISREHLMVSQARTVDLSQEPQYRPSTKTNGTGLPGYKAGWFLLANGDRALVFLTDERRVVYIPTTQDYKLLLSVRDPAGFVQALRRVTMLVN